MPETSPSADLAGPRKAAILFVLLGEDTAGKLMQHLSREQVTKVAREIASLGPIEPVVATRILQDYFVDATRPELEQGGPEIARRLLSRVEIPPEQADGMIGRSADRSAKLLGPVLEADPAILARALAEEHPQTTALILLHLPPARAARVLGALPESARSETVLRMATMRRVRGDLLGEVATSIRERLSTAVPEESESEETDGIERTASVLSSLGRAVTRRLLETLETLDPERAAALRDKVFTFDEARAAYEHLGSGAHFGKIVIRVG
jgi:flagellar motor switch protein FliG